MTREEILNTLLERYAFSVGNAFVVLAKDIPKLLDDFKYLKGKEV